MFMMATMHRVQLRTVDLNLLPALVALLEERSISRAAARIDLSQSAMSRTLQRLRRVFGDELLVRTPQGFQLTPRAERLAAQLADVKPRLERLFHDDVFDAATDDRSWQLAGTDYAAATFATTLFQSVRRQSPPSSMRWHPWHEAVFAQVDQGELDIAFFGVEGPPHLRSEQLYTDRFVCVVGRDHPLAGGAALDLEDYLACSHVVVEVDADGQPAVDRLLNAHGTPRTANLVVPYHATAIQAASASDLVATVPARMLASFADPELCRVLTAPALIQDMKYYMTWHPRNNQDAAHQWLRTVIRAANRPL